LTVAEAVRPPYVRAVRIPGIVMSEAAAERARVPRPLIAGLSAVAVLLALTLALWAHYGTAVFYEMILSGLSACF
jgi:hypothetical protein